MVGPHANTCAGMGGVVHALSFRVALLPAVRHRFGDDAGARVMVPLLPAVRCSHVVLLLQSPKHSPPVEPAHGDGATHLPVAAWPSHSPVAVSLKSSFAASPAWTPTQL